MPTCKICGKQVKNRDIPDDAENWDCAECFWDETILTIDNYIVENNSGLACVDSLNTKPGRLHLTKGSKKR